MYLALKHAHVLTALLSVLMTAVWALMAWKTGAAGAALPGRAKAAYIVHRAVAGLAALTGLAITFIGPWRTMVFPYLGLAAFLVHGLAASASRRSFGNMHETAKRRLALVAQLMVVLAATYLMRAKPF